MCGVLVDDCCAFYWSVGIVGYIMFSSYCCCSGGGGPERNQ